MAAWALSAAVAAAERSEWAFIAPGGKATAEGAARRGGGGGGGAGSGEAAITAACRGLRRPSGARALARAVAGGA